MHLWQYCLLVTARSLYMFRTLSASIIRSTKNCSFFLNCIALLLLRLLHRTLVITSYTCYYSYIVMIRYRITVL